MAKDQSGLWETVRRAMGRLVSSIAVRDLPPSWPLPVPAVLLSKALSGPMPSAGASEAQSQPSAQSVALALPEFMAGAGGADLAPVASVISLDAVCRPTDSLICLAEMPPSSCTVHRLGVADGFVQTAVVQQVLTALSVGAAIRPVVCFPAPATSALTMQAPVLPREARRLWPGRRASPEDLLRPHGGRARSALPVAAALPMRRTRRPIPPGISAATAFADERRHLALSSSVSEEDLVILGVFPQVPVAAVRRLALEGAGALSLWLKPEALVAAAAGKMPRLATLIVGRQRSTGKMLQAVV